eukprot:2030095-Prymnesium_polylepis.1
MRRPPAASCPRSLVPLPVSSFISPATSPLFAALMPRRPLRVPLPFGRAPLAFSLFLPAPSA